MNTQNILLESKYYEFILNIINSRGQWSPITEYWEGHHIIPRCLGGQGHARQRHPNIVRLTAAEHFTAHKLLVELFPNNRKLTYAFWAMCTCSNAADNATAEDYELTRIARSKAIGKDVQAKLIGKTADEQTRDNHSKAQSGILNGFFGKAHTEESRRKMAVATSKAVKHVNTGKVYASSYEAAAALGISRVLINNCCRGKQESTMGGMRFEYVNPQDIDRGIPGKNSLTKYARRREIIEIRKVVVSLNKAFPGILTSEDSQKIVKLATCENRRYLLGLLDLFNKSLDKKELKEHMDGIELSEQLNNTFGFIIRSL